MLFRGIFDKLETLQACFSCVQTGDYAVVRTDNLIYTFTGHGWEPGTPSILYERQTNDKGQLRLVEPTDTTVITPDVFQKISGDFCDGNAYNFTIVNNRLKFLGSDNTVLLFSGVSDLQVNKACEIEYSLFKNGEIVEGAQTPHTFTSPSKTGTISIVSIITLNNGDELDVWVKSNTANTVFSIKTLNIVLWGER